MDAVINHNKKAHKTRKRKGRNDTWGNRRLKCLVAGKGKRVWVIGGGGRRKGGGGEGDGVACWVKPKPCFRA